MSTNYPTRHVNLDAIDPEAERPPPPYQYEKDIVSTKEWITENFTNNLPGRAKGYIVSLFPIFSWIYRYNLTWAAGGVALSPTFC